jgi:predicted PurR-regulated permease PerM
LAIPVKLRSPALAWLAIVVTVAVITFLQTVFLPVAFALLVYVLLEPLVRRFSDRPMLRFGASVVIVSVLIGIIGGSAYLMANPVMEWVRGLPDDLRAVQQQLAPVRQPLEEARETASVIESMSAIEEGEQEEPVQVVKVREPSTMEVALTEAPVALAAVFLTLFLSLLLLARGDRWLDGIAQIPRTPRAQKRLRVAIARIQRDLSRTLSWILLINISLGIATAAAMALWGLPQPYIWGVMVAIANFVPYVGALIVVVLIWISAVVEFQSVAEAFGPALTFFVLTTLEGQVVTPTLLGEGLKVNPFVILLGIALLGLLWGVPGAFLAVPVLVVLRVLADRVPRYRRFSGVLG